MEYGSPPQKTTDLAAKNGNQGMSFALGVDDLTMEIIIASNITGDANMLETKKDDKQPERYHQKDQYPNPCGSIDYAPKQHSKDKDKVKL